MNRSCCATRPEEPLDSPTKLRHRRRAAPRSKRMTCVGPNGMVCELVDNEVGAGEVCVARAMPRQVALR